jgi:hypothetical protein
VREGEVRIEGNERRGGEMIGRIGTDRREREREVDGDGDAATIE